MDGGERQPAAADDPEGRSSMLAGPAGSTPRAPLGLRNIALADVLGVVGLALSLVAWQEFGNGLLYAGEDVDEANDPLRAVLEAVPAILLTAAGFGLLRRTPRADRFGAVLLLVGGVRWLEVGAYAGRSVAIDGWGLGLATGAVLWIALALIARRRSESAYTDVGLAVSIAVGGSRVGPPVIAGAFGIDLVMYETPTVDPGPALPLALAAWYATFAAGAFLLARRLDRRDRRDSIAGSDIWARVLVFDTTAAGLAVLGIQDALTRSYVADRAIVAPASTAILLGLTGVLAGLGVAVRSAPYYVGAVFLLAVAYADAAAESASVLRSWQALVVASLVMGGLAVGARGLERRAAREQVGAFGSGSLRSLVQRRTPRHAGQLQDIVRVSLVDVLALASAGFLLGAWFSWSVDLTGRWSELLRHALPAAVLGALGLALLRRAGSVGRIAGILALVCGVEIALAGGAAFTALTRNEGGVGGLVGAVYWVLFAAFVRYRHGSLATQVGLVAAIVFLGVQGNLVLPVLAFGTPDGEGLPGPIAPGPLLPAMLAAWWAAIGLVLAILALRERRQSTGEARRAAMATGTELAAALVLAIGLANALLNYHAGWERGIQPPLSSALVMLVAVGLLALRARTGSGFYVGAAGIALVFAIGDLNDWLGARYSVPVAMLAGAEGALLLIAVAVATLRRRAPAPSPPVDVTVPDVTVPDG